MAKVLAKGQIVIPKEIREKAISIPEIKLRCR